MSGRPSSHDRPGHREAIRARRDPLIGRERERIELRELLLQDEVGLVALTGPGGAGKTRLALQVMDDLEGEYPDGVRLVSLAPISDPDLILPAIFRALGLEEAGDRPLLPMLVAHLREKRMLLVLDNLEHLLDGVHLLSDILADCPGTTILATSRAALRLTGEHEYPVSPLALPATGPPSDLESFSSIDSVALFVQRARAVRPDFSLTEENAPAVAEICVRLDGLPLAIELAAARLNALPPTSLARRLSASLDTLTRGARDLPARQQTLRDTIAWSYDLLPEREASLVACLSVFVGGFTLDAAEAVAAGTFDVFEGISNLIDSSLVLRASAPDDEPRYEMLETIRDFALERLQASGWAPETRDRHARYFLSLAAEAEPVMFGGNAIGWLARLEADHENLRAAIQWAFDSDQPGLALDLAGALAWFWYDHGHLREGRHWLERALAEAENAPPERRSKALTGVGGLSHRQHDLATATGYLEAGLALSHEAGNDWSMALAMINLGLVRHDQGDYAGAETLHEQSLDLCRAIEHRWGIGVSLNNASWTALFTGNYERARVLGEEALQLRREDDDTLGTAHTLYTLGRIAVEELDIDRARELLTESARLFDSLGERWGVAACLETLAIAVAAGTSDRETVARAARLWGAAEATRDALGAPPTPADVRAHRNHQARIREQVSADVWDEAWLTGRRLSVDEALAEATARSALGSADLSGDDSPDSHLAGLSRREIEVLRLVAEGLSNAEVADRLYLSPRTVGQHLRSIYNKLGVNTRAAATRFAVEHHLV